MRVAIITMAYGANYGNRLQNYAMQELAKIVGGKPRTIRVKPAYNIPLKVRIIGSLKSFAKIILRYQEFT